MKIYFAGSVRGGRDDKELYLQLIEYLGKYGQVLTEHLGDRNLSEYGEDSPPELVHSRDISWLKESDVLIAEVSTPSLGVGYEIGIAESMNKRMLCLCNDEKYKMLSPMINGNSNLKIARYGNLEGAKKHIDSFFESL